MQTIQDERASSEPSEQVFLGLLLGMIAESLCAEAQDVCRGQAMQSAR